jgi:hypothetical protein
MNDAANKEAVTKPGSYNNTPGNNPLINAPEKLAGGDAPTIIQQKITIRPPYRKTLDITDWRNANKSAEAYIPRTVWLYDMYQDVMLDGHLGSVVEKRIMGVTNAKWAFVDKAGKAVDEINDLIDSIAFEDVLRCFVLSRLEGYRMVEAGYTNGKLTTYIVPPKHMRPKTGIVAFEQTGDDGINIREGIYAQTVMEIGKPDDLGILLRAAQYAIYKRGGFGDWANFVEVYGQPIIDAEWDGIDENQRILLEEALDRMGNGGKITRPSGSKITLLENKANANGGVQDKFVDGCNREMSKAVLGQTETTESSDTSGYAQSQTHASVEDDINVSDINYTRRGLNTRYIEILEALGIKTNGGKFVIVDEGAENITKKDKLEMDISLVTDIKLPVDDDYFYETYEIPKPTDYDARKKALVDAANATLVDLNSNPLKPQSAATPPVSEAANDKQPKAAKPKTGKQPAKLKAPTSDDLENIDPEELKKMISTFRNFFA